MTRKTLTLTLAGVLCVIVACALSIPLSVKAQSPVGDALATLAAATAQAQMERQAQEAAYAAQRATIQAIMIEQTRAADQANATATRQAMIVQGTATAVSAEATQSALDELNRQRAATATAQHDVIQATGTAFAQSAQATVTAQAISAAAQATDAAQLSATYAQRQQRFTFGLLLVEVFFVGGSLLIIGWLTRALVRWAQRLAPRPVTRGACVTIAAGDPCRPDVIEQAAPLSATPPLSATRMPSTVTVVDNPDVAAALDRWADRYDQQEMQRVH